MPHRSVASHSLAVVVGSVFTAYLTDILQLYVGPEDVVQMLRTLVQSALDGDLAAASTSLDYSGVGIWLAITVAVAGVWGLAFHYLHMDD